MSTSPAAVEVDAAVWRAVAGASVEIPPINSYVYYFPQGHLEHSSSSSTIQNPDITLGHSLIPCQVLSVRFLSSASFDQVFAKIRLRSVCRHALQLNNNNDNRNDDDDVVSFAKILTPSDANNGGGFSVPRFCADSIFPQLDFAADPPVQNLTIKDTLSIAWSFRHIYRGTPRRHLLTTGWSKFVNAKRLITGDSVVFMRKKSTNELFTGIRRAAEFGARSANGGRSGEVVEAIESAVKGREFEVDYYPRFGLPDFVVQMEKVEAAALRWRAGMRVNWDEPETLPNMNRVNPWQVEYILPTSHLYASIPPPKRFRLSHNPGMPTYAEGELFFPRTESFHPIGSHLNPTVVNHSPFPHSMQGARLNQINNSNQTFTELLKNDKEHEPETVSTVLNIGSPHAENLSPDSQNSVHNSVNSIQLFGTTIQISEHIEGVSVNNVCCTNGERKDEAEERNVDNNPPQL
ncbi:hypothetical protein BUALT_Bualt08G0128000 [Buddleja alternifolia]|uniref:TF-B3 domain-containing protein n=1 Tax=Buddleja alternifolia TaxID=168488 RepID=A0AAV6X748_9LAMI|nr:hypothetical protein BUALT_Bualt08G0128000 [Buddleja alternifolia]